MKLEKISFKKTYIWVLRATLFALMGFMFTLALSFILGDQGSISESIQAFKLNIVLTWHDVTALNGPAILNRWLQGVYYMITLFLIGIPVLIFGFHLLGDLEQSTAEKQKKNHK